MGLQKLCLLQGAVIKQGVPEPPPHLAPILAKLDEMRERVMAPPSPLAPLPKVCVRTLVTVGVCVHVHGIFVAVTGVCLCA